MPDKIRKILIIGPGPVIIGRGGELDLAAVQACRILSEQGYEIAVVDSNPAAVLCDRGIADRVYCEPLTIESLTQVINIEQPDAILPVFGGQTGLNLAYFLNEKGLLKENKIQIIGTSLTAIENTEDLQCFYATLTKLGVDLPKYGIVHTQREGEELGVTIGFPLIVKGAMAPEGAGVITVYNQDELKDGLELALELSPIHQALLSEGLNGWKEIELEMLRDSSGQCRVVRILENIEPVGVHTGDSMTVVPAQSVSESDYHRITKLAKLVMEALGIIGGVNLQIAVNPSDERLVVLEANPRYTRSTALASLATGLPIAALAVRIALGELLTQLWPEAEPIQNNVLFKIPCFDFEKFPTTEPILTSNMKATGAVVGVGSNFKEAFQKALRSIDSSFNDLEDDSIDSRQLREKVMNAHPDRLRFLRYALKKSANPEVIAEQSKFSPWFLNELIELNGFERELNTYALYNLSWKTLLQAKQWGYSDQRLAGFFRTSPAEIREKRLSLQITPQFQRQIGSGSSEGYLYSTYQGNEEMDVSTAGKMILIGGGANRIGQGSDFDHNLYHAAIALKGSGYPNVLVNSNPYSITIDANATSEVYLEPLTTEDLLNIIDHEGASGVICQMGGPAANKLSQEMLQSGVEVLGTNPRLGKVIDDPEQFNQILNKLGLETIKSDRFLISKLMEGAIGVEVDCIADGENAVICGMMEQIEEVGVHPGDSAASLPPYTLGKELLSRVRLVTLRLAKELGIKGMINLYYAVKYDQVYLIDMNLGAGRTVPFVSKITGVDWAGAAAKIMAGVSLVEQNLVAEITLEQTGIKEVVLPFDRFPGVDAVLGPEMRSTGVVMGISSGFGLAFIKSQLAVGGVIPLTGTIYISIRNEERRVFVPIAKQLADLGYKIAAATENSEYLVKNGVSCNVVFQVGEGRPNILDQIKNGNVQWVISTTSDQAVKGEEGLIRSAAVAKGIPIITTLAAAQAGVSGLGTYLKEGLKVEPFNQS